jgi:hypothetical protein
MRQRGKTVHLEENGGCVLRVGLHQPVDFLPWDIQPWDNSSTGADRKLQPIQVVSVRP